VAASAVILMRMAARHLKGSAQSFSRRAVENKIMNINPSPSTSVVRRHLCTGCGACAGLAPRLVPHGGQS
jgi:ferredoxin